MMNNSTLFALNHTYALDYLTTPYGVVILSNMNAMLMLHERHPVSETAFVEIVVWRLPSPLAGCGHPFKYRLALIVSGTSLLLYDNEAGKGDHRHVDKEQHPYVFTTPDALLNDFWNDATRWRC